MDRILLKERVRELSQAVQPWVAPLFLLEADGEEGSKAVGNGSAALLDTGEARLLVTCRHVWFEFSAILKNKPDAKIALGLGLESIDVSDYSVIDSSKSLDLAIIGFKRPESLDGSLKSFHRSFNWPSKSASVGEVIIATGFPGNDRKKSANGNGVIFFTRTVVDYVVSASDRHLVLADTENEREEFVFEPNLEESKSHGGLSGCPAFVERNGVYEFVGIIYESNEGVRATFFISHAKYILSDGRIDHLAIPS